MNTVPEDLLALVDLRVALNTLTWKKMNSNKHTSLLFQSVINDKKIVHNIDASAQSFLEQVQLFQKQHFKLIN